MGWTVNREHDATMYVHVTGECAHEATIDDRRSDLESLSDEERAELGWVPAIEHDAEDEVVKLRTNLALSHEARDNWKARAEKAEAEVKKQSDLAMNALCDAVDEAEKQAAVKAALEKAAEAVVEWWVSHGGRKDMIEWNEAELQAGLRTAVLGVKP